jgi:phosphate transport system protein
MTEHTTRAFDADLHSLALRIAEMSRLDEAQIRQSIEALVKRDMALAEGVIAAKDRVDALQREIEEKAIVTIARRQPMAIDLRELIGALRISNDLEKIGDLAENVAKEVILLSDAFLIDEVILQLQRMGRLVLGQLMRVLRSYERGDAAEALEVWREDLEVDSLNNSLFRETLTYMMENPRNITFCTHLLFCAKNERIGDHATNIAETVYYIVEGRTLPDERPKADLTGVGGRPLPS